MRPLVFNGFGEAAHASPDGLWRGAEVRIGEGRFHYIAEGPSGGRPVLLLHGLGAMAQEIMLALAGPLAAQGFRAIGVDRPGYGLSDPVRKPEMAPAAQARWLVRLIAELGLRRPLVLAHSIAAATALCLATDHPWALGGLVLVNPFCRPTRPAAVPLLRLATAPVVGPIVRRRVLPPLAEPVGLRRLAAACAPDPLAPALRGFPFHCAAQEKAVLAMAHELTGFNGDMIPRCLRLRRTLVPTVAVAAKQDRVSDWTRHARWLTRRLPNAELLAIDGGHMAHHLRPQAVVDAVTRVAALTPCPEAAPAAPDRAIVAQPG